MDDRKRRIEIRDERARDFRTRRRDPGDLVTWAVVLGAFLGVMLFFSAAYDGSTRLGLAVLILLLAWALVIWGRAGVNIVAILWGRSLTSTYDVSKTPLVLLATAALALVAAAFPLMDILSLFDFGWYGVVTGGVGLVYLVMMLVALSRRPS